MYGYIHAYILACKHTCMYMCVFVCVCRRACVPQASPRRIWFPSGVRSQHCERHIKASFHSARREEWRAARAEEDERKIWDTFCFTHTPQNLSLLMEKLQRTSVVLRRESINLRTTTTSLVKTVWLWLPRSSLCHFRGFGMFVLELRHFFFSAHCTGVV